MGILDRFKKQVPEPERAYSAQVFPLNGCAYYEKYFHSLLGDAQSRVFNAGFKPSDTAYWKTGERGYIATINSKPIAYINGPAVDFINSHQGRVAGVQVRLYTNNFGNMFGEISITVW